MKIWSLFLTDNYQLLTFCRQLSGINVVHATEAGMRGGKAAGIDKP
jgi:hypothetical protein